MDSNCPKGKTIFTASSNKCCEKRQFHATYKVIVVKNQEKLVRKIESQVWKFPFTANSYFDVLPRVLPHP